MTTKQLQSLADGIKKPNLKNSEIINLLDIGDFDFMPMDKRQVVQSKSKRVAQAKPQSVAQTVAQTSWVAQSSPQTVAQSRPKQVAQTKPQSVAQVSTPKVVQNPILEKDIERYKEQIYQIQTIEGRKKFCLDIGFGIAVEKRAGKQHYLFGIKKIQGKKYRLYIGNSKSL
jgi:hypothetical protein